MNTAQRIAETNKQSVFAMVGQLGIAEVDDIAAGTGLTKDTVRIHLMTLQDAGRIKRIKVTREDGGKGQYAYRVVATK